MRKLILSAAQRLFAGQGYDKVSIRNIADAIEYSPATIYLYYRDKNELLFELHREGFHHLIEEFQPIFELADPFEQLVEMGRLYIRFAFENPEEFDLMFIMTAPIDTLECRSGDTMPWDEGRAAFDVLLGTVQRCINAGIFREQDAEKAAMLIWSTVHGLAALFLRKRMMIFDEERRKTLMDETFDLFTTIIKKGF